VFWSEAAQILSDEQLSFYFHQRASGSTQKKEEFLWREACLAFRDVGWNQDCCSSQLACQTIEFVTRKCSAGCINGHHKIHGFLPGNQFTIGLSHRNLLRDNGSRLRKKM
jgi:hypothetical protein